MNLSRIRWALAALLALVGLVSAMSALRTYVAHGLVLGVLAVITLAAITVAGMVSLALARKRIGQELAALNATPPTGSLFVQRQQRLQAIKDTGARPDLRALADSTAAQEASRAYFGRYLVATTVLVGLVGTFAGLMETLGKVAPLLSDEGGALALLAAPLSGLHVTFGASLVAIVVTLALSLAQGDLVLHEEQALAQLEDLTHHLLVPTLWPSHADANERTVRLLEGLSEQMAQAVVGALKQATETLNRTQEERFSTLATQLASGATDTVHAVRIHTTETAAALAKTSALVETRLESLTTVLSDKLTESTQQQVLQVSQAVAHVSQRLEQNTDKLMAGWQSQMTAASTAVTTSAQSAIDAWQTQMAATSKAVASSAEDVIAQSALLAEQMNAQLKATLDTAGQALSSSAAQSATLLSRAAERQENQTRTLGERWLASTEALQGTLQTTAQTSVKETAAAVAQSAQALADTLAPLFAAESQERQVLAQALEKNLNSVGDWLARVDQQTQTLEAQAQRHAEALREQAQQHTQTLATTLSETAGQVVKGLGETTLRNGESLQNAADKMLQGARTLEQTLAPLQPRLETLATELERLTHEVALMAAQSDATHGEAVVLAELERVGDGLERLASLVRLAREPEVPELQEAHS